MVEWAKGKKKEDQSGEYVSSKGTTLKLVYKEDTKKKRSKKDQNTKTEKYQCSNIKEITVYQYANNSTTGKYDHEIVDLPKQYDSSSSIPTQGHHLKLYILQRATYATNPWSSNHKLLEHSPRQHCSSTKHKDI